MDKSESESVFVVYVAQIFHGFSQKVHTVFRQFVDTNSLDLLTFAVQKLMVLRKVTR